MAKRKKSLAQQKAEETQKKNQEKMMVPEHSFVIEFGDEKEKKAYFKKPTRDQIAHAVSALHTGSPTDRYKHGCKLIEELFIGGDTLRDEHLISASLNMLDSISDVIEVIALELTDEEKEEYPDAKYKFERQDEEKNACFVKRMNNEDMVEILYTLSTGTEKERYIKAESAFTKCFIPRKADQLTTNFILLDEWKVAASVVMLVLFDIEETSIIKKY